MNRWERITDSKQKKLTGLKIISTYIESGGMFEVPCLSPAVRAELLKRRSKSGDKKFFQAARQEVVAFISGNDALCSAIVACGRS